MGKDSNKYSEGSESSDQDEEALTNRSENFIYRTTTLVANAPQTIAGIEVFMHTK